MEVKAARNAVELEISRSKDMIEYSELLVSLVLVKPNGAAEMEQAMNSMDLLASSFSEDDLYFLNRLAADLKQLNSVEKLKTVKKLSPVLDLGDSREEISDRDWLVCLEVVRHSVPCLNDLERALVRVISYRALGFHRVWSAFLNYVENRCTDKFSPIHGVRQLLSKWDSEQALITVRDVLRKAMLGAEPSLISSLVLSRSTKTNISAIALQGLNLKLPRTEVAYLEVFRIESQTIGQPVYFVGHGTG